MGACQDVIAACETEEELKDMRTEIGTACGHEEIAASSVQPCYICPVPEISTPCALELREMPV